MKKCRLIVIAMLVLLFVSSCSDTNIFRDEKPICEVDGKYFATLQEAVDYALATSSSSRGFIPGIYEETKEVVLTCDLVRSNKQNKGVDVIDSSGKMIVLNLNDHIVDVPENKTFVKVDGNTLIAIKNGTVIQSDLSFEPLFNISNGGSLGLSNVSSSGNNTAVLQNNSSFNVLDNSSVSGGLAIDGSSSFVVDGGSATIQEVKEIDNSVGQIKLVSGSITTTPSIQGSIEIDENNDDPDISCLHKLEFLVQTASGCVTEGEESHYECLYCGMCFLDANGTKHVSEESLKIPANGHKYIEVPAESATCSEAGNEGYYRCKYCNVKFYMENGKYIAYSDDWNPEIPATGEHEFELCSNEEEHWEVCQTCGTTGEHENHNWITKTDDNYHWQVCETCGQTTDSKEHVWKLKINEDQHWYECSICNKEKGCEDHTLSNYVYDTEYHWKECIICNEQFDFHCHEFDGNTCTTCGYVMIEEPAEGEGENPDGEDFIVEK